MSTMTYVFGTLFWLSIIVLGLHLWRSTYATTKTAHIRHLILSELRRAGLVKVYWHVLDGVSFHHLYVRLYWGLNPYALYSASMIDFLHNAGIVNGTEYEDARLIALHRENEVRQAAYVRASELEEELTLEGLRSDTASHIHRHM